MANQFTRAAEEGKPKPPGANQFTTGKRRKHDQATIDKIRAERAAQVAEEILEDPDSSRDQKLAAAKVLLPYGKSTLQSIESREISQWESMSEEEIENMVRALITSHPGLIQRLGIGLRPIQVSSDEPNERGAGATNDP
jgi:Asp-tRNA(Asn)/Glu-tRNA(Gln) amidotransferase B subunit